ncbi:MAG: hypothetical protein HYW49_04505 [Deltaproteobacteria bacterium]|nr:hypothetical protein [Deltaproteobacteria bacterium]
MKTSLVLSDYVFKQAKKAADASGKTISDVIDSWARSGLELSSKRKRKPATYRALDLGIPLVDLNSRREWADLAYDDEHK